MSEGRNTRTLVFLQHHPDNIKSIIGVSFVYVIYSPYFDDVMRFCVFETNIVTQVKCKASWNVSWED